MNKSIEYQIFPETYFSGCDVSIFIGNKWVDEIATINFVLAEQVQPIYGYKSYIWDKIARGNRIIQGTFRINFRESKYLHRILKEHIAENELATKFMSHPKYRTPAEDTLDFVDFFEPKELAEYASKLSPQQQEEISKRLQESIWGSKTIIGAEDTLQEQKYFDYGDEGFNIIITYGVATENPSTFHKIVGVQLTQATQVINPDGSPVFEDYQFVARDLN